MKVLAGSLILTMMILQSYADQKLIETTCKNTPNYQLCVATLQADKGSASADVRGLALIMVGAVKKKTKQAISAVNNLRKSGDPKLEQALQDCARVYGVVLKYDLGMAEEGLTKGNPKFAETGVADTVMEADTCEGTVEEALGQKGKSPLTGMNTEVRDIAEVARAVIRNLL